MRRLRIALLFLLTFSGMTVAQSDERRIVFSGEISLDGEGLSAGQSGYYKPVQPQPYQRRCGTIATDVCEVPVTIPPGATGEQVYQMGRQAAANGRKGEALSYQRKAAELGYAMAQGAYGMALLTGNGAMRDAQKGLYWLELSARQGNRGSEVELGMVYEDGSYGAPHNQGKAIVYLKEAAAQHHSEAEQRLGLDYETGNGLPHDRALAIQWLRRAAADGAPGAGATATALARAKTPQFYSLDEIDAYMAPPVSRPRIGSCGPVPTLSTVMNKYGFDQMHIWCNSHHGCPYQPSYGGAVQYCY